MPTLTRSVALNRAADATPLSLWHALECGTEWQAPRLSLSQCRTLLLKVSQLKDESRMGIGHVFKALSGL